METKKKGAPNKTGFAAPILVNSGGGVNSRKTLLAAGDGT